MRLNVKQILEITGGDLVVAPIDMKDVLLGLTWDSREVKEGWVFAALPGEKVDGHDFIPAAINAGAHCCLVSRRPQESVRLHAREMGCSIVEVSDVAQAITDMARAWRRMLKAKVIGVTGSVGKTTTKNLIRQVLSSTYRTTATKGNFNNELGAPYTVLSADPDCEMLVVEMGMSSLGEIDHICEFAKPDMGIITNVGTAHIEFLKTRENIARAKAELICALPKTTGRAFLPAGCEFNDFIIDLAQTEAKDIQVGVYGGTAEDSQVYATDVAIDGEGYPSFILHAGDQQLPCRLALRGMHNVSNACGAASVGLACGLSLETVAAALAQAQPEAGRQEFKKARGGYIVIDDTYNASPDSCKASLGILKGYATSGHRIAVLGDMGELGEQAEACHRGVGAFAASANVDMLICVGELSRSTAAAALEAGMSPSKVVCTKGVSDTIGKLDEILAPGDVVLVKASHYMGLERVVGGIIA